MTRHRYSSYHARHHSNHHNEATPMDLGSVSTRPHHHHHSASSSRDNTPDRSRSNVPHSPSPYPRAPTTAPRLARLTNLEREALFKQHACFRCRKPGHISRDCPLNQQRTSRPGSAASRSASPRPLSKN
jgi:hypothetical protein